MSADFPIPIPDKLPTHIKKCPIVEAVMEIRFSTSQEWRNLPGLLHPYIRERYSKQIDLPLAQLPPSMQKEQPNLAYFAWMQFLSEDFIIQLGPKVISLITKQNAYPGWDVFKKEMIWLLERIKQADFIEETVRLGVRYIDFFVDDLFTNLVLKASVAGKPIESPELSVAVVLKKDDFTARLQVVNSAIIQMQNQTKKGSILDLDVWLEASNIDIFNKGMDHFDSAHTFVKQIFFGLLEPHFLTRLEPQYQ